MRIVFMGTPDFAVGSLKALTESGKHEIAAVYTQPDRPKGRGNKMLMTPVKEYALEHGFEVYQPLKVKDQEVIEQLQSFNPDLIVVAAFGQFLPKAILEMPKYGCINVHASLLPKYRGAAPIQYAIIKGEKESGVTIMQMDIGMDTGDMLSKVVVPIGEETTMGELHDALMNAGAELLLTAWSPVLLRLFLKTMMRLPMQLFLIEAWSVLIGINLLLRYITLSVALILLLVHILSFLMARA